MAINKGNSVPGAQRKEYLNKMNSVAQKVQLGSLLEAQKGSVRAKYDYAVQGGSTGTINLVDDLGEAVTLPDNAIITHATIDVITQPTSAGTPTVSVGSAATNDILGATAIASVTGILDGVPDGTAANMVKMTAETNLTMTINDDLTDGKFIAFVDYVVSE